MPAFMHTAAVIGGDETLATNGATISGVAGTSRETLELIQGDDDEPFIKVNGTTAASAAKSLSTWTTGATLTGYVRIAVNSTDYWVPYYTAPTS